MGKINSYTKETPSDLLHMLLGSTGTTVGAGITKNYTLGDLKTVLQQTLNLDTSALAAYSAGQITFDPDSKTAVADTGVSGVRVQIGQEMMCLIVNRSGAQIDNGAPVYMSGVDGTELPTVELADANDHTKHHNILGLATSDIPDDGVGLITNYGVVRDFDTSALTAGQEIYLGNTAGTLTNTLPTFPSRRVSMGVVLTSHATTGKVLVTLEYIDHYNVYKDYGFTSQGIGAGTYYRAGYYDFPATDANLTQASTTQTYGGANLAYGAHASIVCGGAGSVDSGVVGIRVNGDSITDDGVLTPADTETISADITTCTLNEYLETNKKWVGTITFELYVVSGTPTTYSLDFNYGFSKYEDFGNVDFTITGIEVVGLAGANDTDFNIRILKHAATGWTYAATGFVPGDSEIVTWSGDMSPYDNLANGDNFAWKRSNLTQFIQGSGNEGIIIEITAGSANSVTSADLHITGVIETVL